MPSPLPNAKRRALRALAEGAAPSFALLADVSGRTPESIKADAEKEAWKIGKGARRGRKVDSAALADRIEMAVAGLVGKVEKLARALAKGEGIEKAELDNLTAMMRALEKIGEFTRPEEAAANTKSENDQELAGVLGLIADKISQLAEERAEERLRRREIEDGAAEASGAGKEGGDGVAAGQAGAIGGKIGSDAQQDEAVR